jgi:hypothetical protein
MSDFTQNLKEKIERSKSKVIQTQEEQNEELIKLFKSSREHLKEALIKDTKRLRKGMTNLAEELENAIERYKEENEELIKNERAESNSRYTMIIMLLIAIMGIMAYPLVKGYLNLDESWLVPKENRYEKDGEKYIVIQEKDIQTTKDGSIYYIQINDTKKGE